MVIASPSTPSTLTSVRLWESLLATNASTTSVAARGLATNSESVVEERTTRWSGGRGLRRLVGAAAGTTAGCWPRAWQPRMAASRWRPWCSAPRTLMHFEVSSGIRPRLTVHLWAQSSGQTSSSAWCSHGWASRTPPMTHKVRGSGRPAVAGAAPSHASPRNEVISGPNSKRPLSRNTSISPKRQELASLLLSTSLRHWCRSRGRCQRAPGRSAPA
mmetsp:Transcript_66689/g.184647  ORF Transcript_66689/g.184647 Transcript_66689/m.184647 type:complete len:216 (-) Transcript_66689:391-1038(-)